MDTTSRANLQAAARARGLNAATVQVARRFPRLLAALTALSAAGVLAGLYLALVFAGTDAVQGHVQRIFYIHMPAFFGATLGYGLAVVGGVQYLRTGQRRWDVLALSGIEVGCALTFINLTTGMIWSRATWNAWWTWDPRLTLEAIMAVTYVAYVLLRGGIQDPHERRYVSSVYAILAFITVILTTFIVRIRPDTIHPIVIEAQRGAGAFAINATPGMTLALLFNLGVWGVLLPATLIWYRIRLEHSSGRAG
ncbi:MAG: cytochrome c biogenesis protein CcsA [Anaerolineae bacterium]|nr:cytochrome c biogenesis protein CcsA [Anaerolineae bacterium]